MALSMASGPRGRAGARHGDQQGQSRSGEERHLRGQDHRQHAAREARDADPQPQPQPQAEEDDAHAARPEEGWRPPRSTPATSSTTRPPTRSPATRPAFRFRMPRPTTPTMRQVDLELLLRLADGPGDGLQEVRLPADRPGEGPGASAELVSSSLLHEEPHHRRQHAGRWRRHGVQPHAAVRDLPAGHPRSGHLHDPLRRPAVRGQLGLYQERPPHAPPAGRIVDGPDRWYRPAQRRHRDLQRAPELVQGLQVPRQALGTGGRQRQQGLGRIEEGHAGGVPDRRPVERTVLEPEGRMGAARGAL